MNHKLMALKTRLEELQYFLSYTLSREGWYLTRVIEDETRQPLFSEFRWVFQGHNLRKKQCLRCSKSYDCIRGRSQGYICIAYYVWGPEKIQCDVNTNSKAQELENVPLDPYIISGFSHIELLGMLFFRKFNFRTITDFSKNALRALILQGEHPISPYAIDNLEKVE